jgi:hypothetical protein
LDTSKGTAAVRRIRVPVQVYPRHKSRNVNQYVQAVAEARALAWVLEGTKLRIQELEARLTGSMQAAVRQILSGGAA